MPRISILPGHFWDRHFWSWAFSFSTQWLRHFIWVCSSPTRLVSQRFSLGFPITSTYWLQLIIYPALGSRYSTFSRWPLSRSLWDWFSQTWLANGCRELAFFEHYFRQLWEFPFPLPPSSGYLFLTHQLDSFLWLAPGCIYHKFLGWLIQLLQCGRSSSPPFGWTWALPSWFC